MGRRNRSIEAPLRGEKNGRRGQASGVGVARARHGLGALGPSGTVAARVLGAGGARPSWRLEALARQRASVPSGSRRRGRVRAEGREERERAEWGPCARERRGEEGRRVAAAGSQGAAAVASSWALGSGFSLEFFFSNFENIFLNNPKIHNNYTKIIYK
jgi:hypothetical protein